MLLQKGFPQQNTSGASLNNTLNECHYFRMDIVNRAHFAVFYALDCFPAELICAVDCGFLGAFEVLDIALVDILFAFVAVISACHELLADSGIGFEIYHGIRCGDTEFFILEIVQPLQVLVPEALVELGALVDTV